VVMKREGKPEPGHQGGNQAQPDSEEKKSKHIEDKGDTRGGMVGGPVLARVQRDVNPGSKSGGEWSEEGSWLRLLSPLPHEHWGRYGEKMHTNETKNGRERQEVVSGRDVASGGGGEGSKGTACKW